MRYIFEATYPTLGGDREILETTAGSVDQATASLLSRLRSYDPTCKPALRLIACANDKTSIIEKNFFGPQKYVAEIITHPPYTTRVNMTRYGYESEHVIYDVVIPERPIQGVTRWYKTNGVSSPFPTATHRRIEIHFNIGIPPYTGQ